MKISKLSILHPFLFAAFPVLVIYTHNIYQIPPKDTVLPILMVMAFSTSVFLINQIIFRNWRKAGIITSIIISLVFSYGHLYSQIAGASIGELALGRHRYLIIPYIITLAISSYYIFKTKRKLDKATTIANTIAFSLIIMIFVNVGTYVFESNNEFQQNILEEQLIDDDKIEISNSIYLGESTSKPDVYYIILDGYGGYESLKNDLGFDNNEFLENLENRGFYIISNSHSNYPGSVLSIASILNMKYLNYLSEELGKDSQDWHTLFYLLNNNEVMKNFHTLGYKIINFDTPAYEQKSDLRLCESKSIIPNNELMSLVVKVSFFEHFIYALSDQEDRERILCIFDEIPEVSNDINEPVFVHAHLNIPHPPYLFGSNGEQIIYKPYHNDDEIDEERYLGTLQYANKRILEIVDKIQSENQQAIIIISSDHGTDFGDFDWENPSKEMLKQRLSNLNALYFPNKGENMFYDGMSSVNTFRILFNTYFNSTYPILEDKSYWNTYSKLYDLKDVTKIINEN